VVTTIVPVTAIPYAEARALAERALAIQERALGSEHPEVALTLTHPALGTVEHRYDDVLDWLRIVNDR